jgi:MraZ protein
MPVVRSGPKWNEMALRGSYPVRLDDKGRLKIPAEYRAYIESTYGSRVFMTSDDEETVRIYPLPIWEGIEAKLAAAPTTEESVTKYLDLVNYYGSSGEFDAQGRLVISPRLRTMARIDQDVEIWQGAVARDLEPVTGRPADQGPEADARRPAGAQGPRDLTWTPSWRRTSR